MKTPRIILEWTCDGIGCTQTVQLEAPAMTLPLAEADLQRIAEGGGLPPAWTLDVVLSHLRRSAAARA